jgi:hypothetical protein
VLLNIDPESLETYTGSDSFADEVYYYLWATYKPNTRQLTGIDNTEFGSHIEYASTEAYVEIYTPYGIADNFEEGWPHSQYISVYNTSKSYYMLPGVASSSYFQYKSTSYGRSQSLAINNGE